MAPAFYNIFAGGFIMKHMLMVVMAVAVAISFSVPAFANEEKNHDKKGGHADTLGDEKKKDEHKGGH
jgi:competence protein ComGC